MSDTPIVKSATEQVRTEKIKPVGLVIVKIVALFGPLTVLVLMFLYRQFYTRTSINRVSTDDGQHVWEYRVQYQNTLYEDFGFIKNPTIALPTKTLTGFEEQTYLIDSGAVISTLPFSQADAAGIDLSEAKRITLHGFTDIPDFAYVATLTVQIGDFEYSLPAAYTESDEAEYILGRLGFFDDFTILFDSEKKEIVLSTKKRG